MTAHTHTIPLRPGFKLSELEIRELFRMHIRALLAEIPSGDLGNIPVAELTKRIEPHLNRCCDLFTQLKDFEINPKPSNQET